jgi:hypothetical protein
MPFTTAELHPAVIEALGCAPEHYTLASSYSSSSSNASMRRLPQAFSAPSKRMGQAEIACGLRAWRLYQRVIDDLDALVRAVGLKAA